MSLLIAAVVSALVPSETMNKSYAACGDICAELFPSKEEPFCTGHAVYAILSQSGGVPTNSMSLPLVAAFLTRLKR